MSQEQAESIADNQFAIWLELTKKAKSQEDFEQILELKNENDNL